MAANGLFRYTMGAVFPLFTFQVCDFEFTLLERKTNANV